MEALERHGGDRLKAVLELGTSPMTLRRRLRKYSQDPGHGR